MLLVEAHRPRATRHDGEQLDALHYAADERDVAIERARRLADDGVELGAVARIHGVVAPHADGAVAVDEPGLVPLGIARNAEARRETDFGREGVRVGQARE